MNPVIVPGRHHTLRAPFQTARRTAELLGDYASFIKLKLSLLVLFSGMVGFFLASKGWNLPLFLAFTLGSLGVIGGANAFNEIIERREDALMRRTAGRPLPSGRMTAAHACAFATAVTLSGVAILGFLVNPVTALLAAIAFVIYVFAYTPAKKIGPWCTLVGAIPGAIPAMMGPAAVQQAITPLAWLLFGIVFLWQFPHFFAIAWLVRDDYRRAGFRILPVPQNERLVAYEVLFSSCLLVAVSPLVALIGHAGVSYFVGSLALSLLLFAYAVRFWFKLAAPQAGQLMRVALAYLPFLFILMLIDKVVRP